MITGEILAPAGSLDAVKAAVRSGADAVYLGAGDFNARRNAKNFSLEELRWAVDYCHQNAVNVHLTLNTLVSDDEIEDAVRTATEAAKCGVDAIIIQDVGLFSIIKDVITSMPLHASTQISVQTKYGIDFLKRNGFTRAVLPREISKSEILSLLETSGIELEVFVHGALCMCVSGQCYMSAVIGKRSGNRGLCAQPCRLPFSCTNKMSYDLSLKDNSIIGNIKELNDAGMTSFKIEGRMKRPEYVAAAVKACRNALDGKNDEHLKENLKNVFSRSGFTDGYYLSKIGKEMFGTRQKSDVENSMKVLGELKKIYEKEFPKFEVEFDITIRKNKKVLLIAKCEGFKTEVFSDDNAQEAKSKPLSKDDVKKQLQKLGATQFRAGKIICEIDENAYVPISLLNEMRRNAIQKLVEKISEKETHVIKDFKPEKLEEHVAKGQKSYYVFSSSKQVPETLKNEEIFLPLFTDENDFLNYQSAGVVMPRGIMHNADIVYEKMKKLFSIGVKKALCPTIDTFQMAKELGFYTIMGFTSNIYNSKSLEFFKKNGADECTVSIEISKNKINALMSDITRGVVIYGKIPLMLTRCCPIKNQKTCSQCKGKSVLKDRRGFEFEVVCSNSFSEVLNSCPLYLFDKLEDFKNSDFFMLYFTTESREEVQEIIKKYELSSPPGDIKFTRGLYYRKEA